MTDKEVERLIKRLMAFLRDKRSNVRPCIGCMTGVSGRGARQEEGTVTKAQIIQKTLGEMKLIPLENMLVRITQQDVVYRRYLLPEHRSYVPDFGVYIKTQGAKGDVGYRAISRQLVLFSVERRKAWRMLQSKAGIVNKDYAAQRSILVDVDAGKISKEELFARGEKLMRDRLQPVGVAKPAEPRPGPVLVS